jgi:hypothetical protein
MNVKMFWVIALLSCCIVGGTWYGFSRRAASAQLDSNSELLIFRAVLCPFSTEKGAKAVFGYFFSSGAIFFVAYFNKYITLLT